MRSTTKRALAIIGTGTALAASIVGVGVASAQDHDGRRHRGDVHQRYDRDRDARDHRRWDHRRNDRWDHRRSDRWDHRRDDRWDHRWDHHRWRSHVRVRPRVQYWYAPRRDDYRGYASPLYRHDHNRDGFISPYEARADWRLWQQFDWLDRDRDGFLSPYEIQLYYR